MKNTIKFISTILIITIIISIINLFNCDEIFAITQKIISDIKSIDDSKYPGIKSQIQALQKAAAF